MIKKVDLNKKIINKNGQPEVKAIWLFEHLNTLKDIVIGEDGFFRYEYFRLEEDLNWSHKVVNRNLNILKKFGFIDFEPRVVKREQNGILFIRIIEGIEDSRESEVLTIEDRGVDIQGKTPIPGGSQVMPLKESSCNCNSIDINEIEEDDDEDDYDMSASGIEDEVKNQLFAIRTKILAMETNEYSLSLKRLFGSKIYGLIDGDGNIWLEKHNMAAIDILESINLMSPRQIEKVMENVMGRSNISDWDAYVLTSLYRKSIQHRSEPKRGKTKKEQIRFGSSQRHKYDFPALYKFINEN